MSKLAFMHQRSIEAIEAEPARLGELAARLGVTTAALRRLDVGWREDVVLVGEQWAFTGVWAWIFPEVDGRQEVVGLLRRSSATPRPCRSTSSLTPRPARPAPPGGPGRQGRGASSSRSSARA
jgi:hypothetical protein